MDTKKDVHSQRQREEAFELYLNAIYLFESML